MPKAAISSRGILVRNIDTTTLQMALLGYETARQKIHEKITDLQRQLKSRNHRAAARNISWRHRPPQVTMGVDAQNLRMDVRRVVDQLRSGATASWATVCCEFPTGETGAAHERPGDRKEKGP